MLYSNSISGIKVAFNFIDGYFKKLLMSLMLPLICLAPDFTPLPEVFFLKNHRE